MKKNFFTAVLVFVALYVVSGCSTKLDMAAPYKEIPIVFGLLNKDDSIHYIKVNKAFLNTDGSASVAGSVADSNMFPYPLEVKLYARNPTTGALVDSVTLDTTRILKSSGTFQANDIYYATPVYKLKYIGIVRTDTTWATYDLVVRKVADRSILVKASTTIVSDFNFNNGMLEVGVYNAITKKYVDKLLSWAHPKNGKKYNSFFRFKFREVNSENGETRDDSLDFRMVQGGTSVGTSMLFNLSGVGFYNFIQLKLDPLPVKFRREYVGPLEFHYEVAGVELSNYMDINNNSVGLSDVRPEYTNIDGGLGVFSSRLKKVFNDRKQTNLSLASIEGLKLGDITGRAAGANDLGFR